MRILGIDPGLGRVGLGLIEKEGQSSISVLEWVTIETPAHTDTGARLVEIQKDLDTYLDETKPDLAVIEQIFLSVNHKTAIAVSQARGVLLLCIARRGIPVIEPTPSQMKSTLTGDGSASKDQILSMLQQELKLTDTPSTDDAADALALAYYGALTQKQMPLVG